MRVLFVQVARDDAPEYGNHRRHAANAGPGIAAVFIRQAATPFTPARSRYKRDESGEHYFFEFGRNLSLEPRPSRARRALMMGVAAPLSLPAIIRTARRARPDVIYTSQQRHDVHLGLLLSRLLRVPHVIALHYPVGPWLGQRTLARIRQSQRLVAVSDYVRQTAIEHGADPDAIRVVHNSLDISPFLEAAGDSPVRRELGIPDAAPLIASLGRLDPDKGHIDLLRAMARLHTRLPDARLLICGQPFTRADFEAHLRAEAEHLGVAERVVFAGFRRDIPQILAESDLFCLPSRAEAFGMVYLEAMAAALPVVAYHSGGIPEIVVHEETGLLAEQNDVETLASYLECLLTDRKRAQRMGAAGRERVRTRFVPAVWAPHWAKTVREMAEPSVSGARQADPSPETPQD
jgi:glycosyltransferase involved in cell wall biosynthesis